MTSVSADIVVTNDAGHIAHIEVKNPQDLSPERAAALRRSVLTYGQFPTSQYFLVVSQDKGYLWHEKNDGDISSPPDVEFSMHDVLAHHYNSPVLNKHLDEEALKTLVFHWLSELAVDQSVADDSTVAPLEQAGFIRAIRGGTTTMVVA